MKATNMDRSISNFEEEVIDFMEEIFTKSEYATYCKKFTKNDWEAKYLLDEVVFKVYDDRHKYKSVQGLKKAWYRIVYNTFIAIENAEEIVAELLSRVLNERAKLARHKEDEHV